MSKYRVEIQQMMFILGEVQDPLPETIQLVEELIRGQVMEMLIQANELSIRRGSRSINVEDLFFLIRHDRAKVNRLKTYLSWKEVRKKAKEQDANAADTKELFEEVESKTKTLTAPVAMPWEVKNMFSEPVPETEEFEDDDDMMEMAYATRERLKSADERTKKMTREEYVHWSECRQASFTYRKGKRFREWCGMSLLTETRPDNDLVDILGFLTFEIVATLTEEALAVKERMDQIQNNTRHGSYSVPNHPKERYLFDGLTEGRTPLQIFHVLEAFRRLQVPNKKHTAMRSFNGGLVKSRVYLI
ncbi:SAGA complex subunit Spt3 [Schizosaccharomyces cryophilus OY26]|uniref:SAGA complex subunit Spt3 n=1 Tax=Schizosaccharomyces cryophilus (strain OY26 / ATCC MYA-4695 / CBS 11777 / NBRC 106824 / NRRL Y48691) TaxID=653667 RepID=S9XEB6_SCHCR|nr:SAGA complex subunit Spt3 [Schizosaccharomyces cryophilus OY26]EPY52121.1 SAGA complex subunit Spt3 [Schizosaccharomyces cryophilus OY26]